MRSIPVTSNETSAGEERVVTAQFGVSPVAARSDPQAGLADAFLTGLVVVLGGYAFFGKGFAYLGLGPVFIGEILLGVGLLVVAFTRVSLRIPRVSTTGWLLLFIGWCALRSIPGIRDHGVEALRDSVVWGYALFALILAGLLVSRPVRLARLVRCYRAFGKAFVLMVPVMAISNLFYYDAIPRVPGTDVAMIDLKSGDVLTHLAGIMTFQMVGLARAPALSLVAQWFAFATMSILSRGGMLAFLIPVGLVAALRPLRRRLWIGAGALLLLAPLYFAPNTSLEFKGRELSGPQLVRNALSIVGVDWSGGLGNTRSWRLDWWYRIVGYTLQGQYFWTGKGFGTNLASSDGFDVDIGRTLRSPHNVHFTLLARTGVPGAALWLMLQSSWAGRMLRSCRRSRRLGQGGWAGLFLFLLAFWLALLVNASFDVFLEGPMGGVWFWSVFGTGMAAAHIQRRWPWALASANDPLRRPKILRAWRGKRKRNWEPASEGMGR